MWVLLLSALALEGGYLALNRLDNFKQFSVEYIAISLVTFPFYLVACWRVGKREPTRRRTELLVIVLAGIVFRLTLMGLNPSLTEDPYRYRWEGKLQAAGGNPYLERPEDQRWAGLRDAGWGMVNRKELPTGYGPLLEWSYRWTYALVSRLTTDVQQQIRLFKIPYLVFDLATAALLAMWSPHTLLIYFWSPLVVVEFWGSGHNDSVLLFFLVAAVWAASAGRWGWAYGGLWMATLTKFWPAALFPLFWRSGGRLRSALAWTPLAALIAYPYWGGAGELRQMLAGFLGGWRNNASLFNGIYAIWGPDYERAKPVVTVLVVAAVLLVAWWRPPIIQGTLCTAAALLFLSANCFPWYLTWLVPFLALCLQPGLLLWTGLVPLAYHILIPYQVLGQWVEDPFFLYLEYVPVYGMLAGRWLASRSVMFESSARPNASKSTAG